MLRILAAALLTGLIALSVTVEPAAGLRRYGGASVAPPPVIHGVAWSTPFRYNTMYPTNWGTGDGYQTAWADNDNLYTNVKDTRRGWQEEDAANNGSNLAIARLTGPVTGTPSASNTLIGTKVNNMRSAANGGPAGQSWDLGAFATAGTDTGTSKMAGLLSVGGALYGQYYRGILANGTAIIKSPDHGASWVQQGGALPTSTQVIPTNFPTSPQMQAYTWVYYPEKDYPPIQAQNLVDGNNQYVYAAWVDTAAASPRHVFISRVSISLLPNLNGGDWQWWQSGGTWGAFAAASSVLTLPTMPANASGPYDIQWLPYYQQYMMVVYTNTGTSTNTWTLFTAQHPWGPWTQLQQTTWTPQAFYNSSIIAKSVAPDGGQHFWVITAGDYTTSNGTNDQNSYYCIWLTQGTVS